MNPSTHQDTIEYVLDVVDQVLVMSVNPGFGGQSMIPSALKKVAAIRKMIDDRKLPIDLEIDGGINAETARQAVDAGARVLVAGSAVFDTKDYKTAIAAIRGANNEAPRARRGAAFVLTLAACSSPTPTAPHPPRRHAPRSPVPLTERRCRGSRATPPATVGHA